MTDRERFQNGAFDGLDVTIIGMTASDAHARRVT